MSHSRLLRLTRRVPCSVPMNASLGREHDFVLAITPSAFTDNTLLASQASGGVTTTGYRTAFTSYSLSANTRA